VGNRPSIEVWLKAPIIIVGEIADVKINGKSSISHGDWAIDVHLHEISVKVETVVKGQMNKSSIRVYRYGFFGGQIPRNLQVNNIVPGERRVLFLIPHGSEFRMVEDVVAGSFLVASGRHLEPMQNKPVAQQIAQILVLPGERFNEPDFVRTLDVQVSSTVYALVGLRGTAFLLTELLSRGTGSVSSQACISLYKLHPLGHECIESLLQDSTTSQSMQIKILETIKLYGNGKKKELEQFRRQPGDWFGAWVASEKHLSYVAASYQDDARYLLTKMSQRSDDPAIQRNARMLLEEYVPYI
jgi:hypothetical protein